MKKETNADYLPIENHGVIGDLNTIALVNLSGSIDFMCFPDFDSPSIFASLLDAEKGGSFDINPVFDDMKTRQLYLPDTNVLLTRFLSVEGVGEITDFMPVEELYSGKKLIRRVTTVRGKVRYEMKCKPRFNYGQTSHKIEKISNHEILFISEEENPLRLRLLSTVPLKIEGKNVMADFILNGTETADFLFEHLEKKSNQDKNLEKFVTQSLFDTVNYWKDWIDHSNYTGR